LEIGGERVDAAAVINAAGAWGDQLAERCGVAPLGLKALRRTAAIVSVPDDRAEQVAAWPLVIDVADRCWFEPNQDGLLISPADEHPSSPCDAQADEQDVVRAVEQVGQATGLALLQVRRSWAGLRTFTRDRAPAVGADPTVQGFIWLVGQGGAGIKTAPALGALAAAAALGTPPPPLATAATGLDLAVIDPGRFAGRRPALITPAND
jgi:D-arginine dehydrogenase